jgi:ABC-type sugar transport system permease subunit
MIVMTVWGAVPVATRMYPTGLQAIGRDGLEATRFDGAGEPARRISAKVVIGVLPEVYGLAGAVKG